MTSAALVSWMRTKLKVTNFEDKYKDVNQIINDLKGIEKYDQVIGALESNKGLIASEIIEPIQNSQDSYNKSLSILKSSSSDVGDVTSITIQGTQKQKEELQSLQEEAIDKLTKIQLSQQIEADLINDIEDAFNVSYDEGNMAAALQYFDERISSLQSQQDELEDYNKSAYRRIRSLIKSYREDLKDLPDI